MTSRPTLPPVPVASDLLRLIEFLNQAGYVERENVRWSTDKTYEISYNPDGAAVKTGYQPSDAIIVYWELTLGQGLGYTGFMCIFYFNDTGVLLHHGLWE